MAEKVQTFLSIKEVEYEVNDKKFKFDITVEDVVRHFKGLFRTKELFKLRIIDEIVKAWTEYPEFYCKDLTDKMLEIYDDVKPFTYTEAFKIKSPEFRALVFGSINITEMIDKLGHTRIATDGIKVKHKQFDKNGNFNGHVEYDNIYEVHEVNGKDLGVREKLYILKCWCTSTNKEHWLWINPEFKDKPLEAVASTFMVHENIIPHIKEIKRQGDVLLVEMEKDVEPEGDIVPLTAKQYFSLLTCQS